jgi:outer membrane receptor protein involved in Fe transport
VLHAELPVNANYNPTGASLDQDRYHLSLGLDGSSSLGDWSVSLAATRTNDDLLRGFLRGTAFMDPPDGGVGDGLQADGYDQSREITDLYLDFHLTTKVSDGLSLTYGADYLYGDGSQDATNFGYCIDASGSEQVCDGAHHPDELVSSADRRNFAGLYAQVLWQLSDSVDVMTGLRFNYTHESAHGQAIDNTGPTPVIAFDGSEERSNTRPSGVIGANWHAWSTGADELTFYADYRNTYKPLAIDFGPEAETDVLQPESAESYETGAKLQLMDGRFDLDASVFRMDFRNGLTFEDDGTGNFVRANGGETRFQGFEIESEYQWLPQLELAAHYAYHDARFVRFTRDNGADAAGNRFEMSPCNFCGI